MKKNIIFVVLYFLCVMNLICDIDEIKVYTQLAFRDEITDLNNNSSEINKSNQIIDEHPIVSTRSIFLKKPFYSSKKNPAII